MAALLICAGGMTGQAAPVIEIPYANVFTNPVTTGSLPYSALVMGDGGVLFGTTTGGGPSATNGIGSGVLFKINPDGGNFVVLHYFGVTTNDGFSGVVPSYSINGGNVGGIMIARNGRIYGTCPWGGTNNLGTLYSVQQNGNDYRVLHSFGPGGDNNPVAAPIQGSDGALYGTSGQSPGYVYRINTDGSGYTLLHALFERTSSGVIQGQDGLLYGTSGLNPAVVYRMDTNGNNYTNLYTFSGGADGALPHGTLVQVPGGALFGTCRNGGATISGGSTVGLVYKINPDGTGFQVVHTFSDGTVLNDQAAPCSGLVIGPGGYLFGTTSGGSGGSLVSGVYQIAQDGSGYTQVYNFIHNNIDPLRPQGALCVGSSAGTSGILFGTGVIGGQNGNGAIFALVVNPPATITPVTGSNGVTVFWPSWALGFRLQTSATVNGTWADVTNGTPVIGVQLPAPTTNAFYRLIAQ